MNKSSTFTLVLVVLSTLFCFVKCQTEKTYLNIALESKEPSTIQTFIMWKWHVLYRVSKIIIYEQIINIYSGVSRAKYAFLLCEMSNGKNIFKHCFGK